MELRDRICVVTGGASGIGRALCLRFAAEGARAVVVVDRDADGALATADAIGTQAVASTADVTVEADIRVSCVCPMAVDTPMYTSGLDTGGSGPGAAATTGVISAEAVADAAVAGLRNERFLILPHPDVALFEQRRASDRDRWLSGMRRLAAP